MSTASESQSSARGNGLTQVLAKARRVRKAVTTDTSSLVSKGSDGSLSIRGKFASSTDKLKTQDGSDDDDGDNGGLKKLIPKAINSKRRRKKEEKEAEQRASEEAARGRSVAERGTLENDDRDTNSVPDGDGSSLVTYESENEESSAIPPPLSSHQSHIGYLTTSSPLVKSTTLPEGSYPELQLDGTSRAITFPAKAPLFSPTFNTASLEAPSEGSTKRASSPVGRLKEAFTTQRGSSASPDRKAEAGGLGADSASERTTSREERRGSVASRIGAIFPGRDSPQAVPPVPPLDLQRPAKVAQLVGTKERPQTPPNGENIAPLIVNTPPTPTESTPPSFPSTGELSTSEPTYSATANVVTSPSGNMISHRRVRSNTATLGPSKLSNITAAPLTPTTESAGTPPGTNQQSGFFSSVFSAAQNAANTLSNSISNTSLASGQAKNRNGTQEVKNIDDVEVETAGEKIDSGDDTGQKEPAVKTLGMGDLSLSHLGISETSTAGNTPMSAKFPDVDEQRGRPDSANREDSAAIRPYGTGESTEAKTVNNVEDVQSATRPRSVYEPRFDGDQTPPNGSFVDDKTKLTRAGSIRSAINGSSRRKRGSSATTGTTTIGAAIMAANASVANPQAQGSSTPKLTGFAVASKKRNRDFHQLFRSVPDDDYLIEDYSCALQREILAHGRLYVSEGHLCFSSNIFGWVTTLVMSFDEIVSVEKRSTALLFKNGLMISTLHAKNIFASFTSRDSTYDLIVGIWKLGHPSLRSSLNGVRIDETGGGDKTEKYDGNASQSGSGSEEESEEGEVYDEDDEDDDGMSFTQAGEGSVSGSDLPDKAIGRKPSAAILTANGATAVKNIDVSPVVQAGDVLGPLVHSPTECTDLPTHYDIILADEIIPAPLGKTYDTLFGPGSVSWMSKWLTNEQKCLEFTTEDTKGLTNDNRVRVCSYIKPLNGSIGPRQTKCIVTENLDSIDLERAVSVTMSTQTPDVPSGNVFTTKTKYCLSWGEGNGTRFQMNCAIEWTGKSWLKGPIEKGAKDGQTLYARDLVVSLRAALSSHRTTATVPGKSKKKSRKEKSRSSPGETDGASDSKRTVAKEDWGLLEPFHGPLGPVVDIIKPLVNGNMVYGLLVGLLVAAWFSFGYSSRGTSSSKYLSGPFVGSPERIAAYEEIWRREESELWTWLEDRVGMDKLSQGRASLGTDKIGGGRTRYADHAKNIEEKLKEERVSEREIDTAIKVTEEKLRLLKGLVERQKEAKESEGKSSAGVSVASSTLDDGDGLL